MYQHYYYFILELHFFNLTCKESIETNKQTNKQANKQTNTKKNKERNKQTPEQTNKGRKKHIIKSIYSLV